jgi:hypothetical protein
MISKATTANSAPIGSLTIASQRNSEAGRASSWAWRSSGMITVGPVTTRIAPSTIAVGQLSPPM